MKQPYILSLLVILYFSCNLSGFEDMQFSSEKELKENYAKKQKEISNLKSYFNSIVPKEFDVDIEFKTDTSIDLKVFYSAKPTPPRKMLFEQWDINPYNFKHQPSPLDSGEFAAETTSLDVVKGKLNWIDGTFKTIKKHLDNANCISVTNGDPTNIGFRRSGMGMYFYNIFNNTLVGNRRKDYNDSCIYRLYNDTVVLEYGGGAIGSQCFPDN